MSGIFVSYQREEQGVARKPALAATDTDLKTLLRFPAWPKTPLPSSGLPHWKQVHGNLLLKGIGFERRGWSQRKRP